MSIRRRKGSKDWLDADGCFLFGRHRGRPATQAVATDASYVRWIVEDVDDCSPDDREILRTLLERQGQGG